MRTNELMLYKNMEYGEILKDITFLIDHYESEYYNREDLRALLFDCINELLELSVSHGFEGNLWHTYLTFLLASDENALKYASKWLGKTTIAGVQTSVSEETPEKEEDASASITQPLMQETIRRLPVGMCLVLIKDMPATLDEKFCGYLK